MKHIVCFSGGKSSALVAAMVVNKFGKDNVILLNHQVDAEPNDVERFEKEVASYLGVEITYANGDYKELTPLGIFEKRNAFGIRGMALCTSELKTVPFYKWLKENYNEEDVIYYGFDANEQHRIQRKIGVMAADDYKTDYPLALWENPLDESWFSSVGIAPPNQYSHFKHGNCMCCWKAGKQSWYVYYINCRELFMQHLVKEEEIGHSIHRDWYLSDMLPEYEKWEKAGIPATEHIPTGQFFKMVRTIDPDSEGLDETVLPCDCIF